MEYIKNSFLAVLNMSITASYVLVFVLFARLILKKAPKIFSYSLWAVVLFRLICPFSFSSTLSFLGFLKAKDLEHIPDTTSLTGLLQGNVNTIDLSQAVNNYVPTQGMAVSANPMDAILVVVSIIWALGIAALLIYSILSFLQLKRRVSTAILLEGNIYECENIQSPFVLGIIKPKIYLPVGFSDKEKSYILKHEETHIKRFDYLVKPFAFLVMCIHWFNPLVWVGFILMNRDMEMSCDEHVLKNMGTDIKKDYSSSLLSLATYRNVVSVSPLAFGESNTKGRIKNVLNYKKPAFWVIILAAVGFAALSIGLLSNPKRVEAEISSIGLESTISEAMQRETLLLRGHGFGATLAAGNEFGLWLKEASPGWIETDKPALEPSPTLTVYINNLKRLEMNFYKSKPELAMISCDGKHQYYTIPKDDYDEVYMMHAIRSYMIPDDVINALVGGKRTNKQSIQDVPNGGDCKSIKIGKEVYYIYEKGGKYYCEQPYQYINEITKTDYNNTLKYASMFKQEEKPEASSEIINLVEGYLAEIISSTQPSSSKDYVNLRAYQDILKLGEDSLNYMLTQFSEGNVEGVRGQIMMSLCRELLGERNNVSDETLSPKEWYSRLEIRQKVEVPDFIYRGNDPVEKLIYETEVQKHKSSRGGFTIVAPHIFGSYEEGNRLKVFVTTYGSSYVLYDKALSEEGAGIIPAAITYVKNPDGSYTLEKYEQAEDGSYFAPSIKKYCVMPVSGKKINGLADKILKHYGDYKDILELGRQNLIEHLKVNNQFGVFMHQEYYEKPDEIIPLT